MIHMHGIFVSHLSIRTTHIMPTDVYITNMPYIVSTKYDLLRGMVQLFK